MTFIRGCRVQYSRAKAGETKRNLFAVLFDYVLQDLVHASSLSGRRPPRIEEIQAVASSLALAEAPESFALVFKQGVHGVGDSIAKSIVTAMARDVTNGRLNAAVHFSSRLPTSCIVYLSDQVTLGHDVLYAFQSFFISSCSYHGRSFLFLFGTVPNQLAVLTPLESNMLSTSLIIL